MWALLKSLLAKWAVFKVLLKTLGSLAWLIPIAFILKAIGIPMLLLLAILAAPILIVLAVIGLPFLLVIVLGGAMLSVIFAVLSIGIAALKIVLPILVVVWLVNWLLGWGRKDVPPTPDAPPA